MASVATSELAKSRLSRQATKHLRTRNPTPAASLGNHVAYYPLMAKFKLTQLLVSEHRPCCADSPPGTTSLWPAPVDASVFRNWTAARFVMIATAPGAALKAASALRRARGRQRTVQAPGREAPSNPAPAGLEPALLRTASVQAPGPAQSPTSAVRASGMKPLLQARLWAKARLLRRWPWVARDPPQPRAAVPPQRPPAAAEQLWGRMTSEPWRQHSAFQLR